MKRTISAVALLFIIKWYGTADDMVLAINRLSEPQRRTMQIVVAPSNRNEGSMIFGGVLGSLVGEPYGLLYDVEAK